MKTPKRKVGLACIIMTSLAALSAPLYAQALSGDDATSCDALQFQEGLTPDCRLDVNGFVLWFDYETQEPPTRVTVRQTDRSGQQLSENDKHDVRNASWLPTVRQITADDRPEVLLALYSEAGNTTFKVYQPDVEGTFYASGEIAAVSPEYIASLDGLTVAITNGGPDTWFETAFKSDEWHGFERVYQVKIDEAAGTCSLVDGAGLGEAGISSDAVLSRCTARLQ